MKNIIRILLGKLNIAFSFVLTFVLTGLVGTTAYVWAATTAEFSQTISQGTLSVDFVDENLDPVANPSVPMAGTTFSFGTQDSNGQLGTNTQRIIAINPTTTAGWTVSIAASLPTSVWTNGSNDKFFDFNDPNGYTDGGDLDAYGGQMTIDPSGGTIAGVDGCDTTDITKGTADSFEEGTTNNITIMTAGASAIPECRWYFIGDAGNVTQNIPAAQSVDSYSLDLTLSIGV